MTPNFSAQSKLLAIRREISMRRRVYGRQVTANRMTQANADMEIAMFEQIAADYEKLAEAERSR